jgi:excisionase family DNA binding protein
MATRSATLAGGEGVRVSTGKQPAQNGRERIEGNFRESEAVEMLATALAALRADPAAYPVVLAELRELVGIRPSVYTTQTLAAELGITDRAVRAAIGRGDLQARRSGRGWLITAEAVAEAGTPARTRTRRRAPRRSRPMRNAIDRLSDSQC